MAIFTMVGEIGQLARSDLMARKVEAAKGKHQDIGTKCILN